MLAEGLRGMRFRGGELMQSLGVIDAGVEFINGALGGRFQLVGADGGVDGSQLAWN
jgi:hypothetical protein